MNKNFNIINFIIFLLVSNSIFAMNNEIALQQSNLPESIVKILSMDGQIFTIDLDTANTSQTLKNMIEDIGSENEESDVFLPNFSAQQFGIMLPAMHNLAKKNLVELSQKKSKEDNKKILAQQLQQIITNLKSNDQRLNNQQLIQFITGANYLDISLYKSEISLVEPGLKKLSKRILNQDDWLELESLGDKLIDLWQSHPAKEFMAQILSLKHDGCSGVIENSNGKNYTSWSCKDGTIKIWDINNFQAPIILQHPKCKGAIESYNGNLISYSIEGAIKIWNGKNLNNPDIKPKTLQHPECEGVIESSNGNLISWSRKNGTIKIWNINNLDQTPIILQHCNCVDIIESADGNNYISYGGRAIKKWNIKNLQNVICFNHKTIKSSYDKNYISYEDGNIRIWDINNLQNSIILKHPSCKGAIKSSDGNNYISSGGDIIKIWDINNLEQDPIILKHSGCKALIESSNGNNYISYSANNIKIWDINNLAQEPITLKHPECDNVIESSDGNNLISWSSSGMKIWNMAFINPTPKQIYLFLAVYFASKENQKFDLPNEKLSELKIIFNELSSIAQASLEQKAPSFITKIKKAV